MRKLGLIATVPLWVVAPVLAQTETPQPSVAASETSASAHSTDTEDASTPRSPWLLVPTISSNPKIGTSAGLVAGYLFHTDPESTSSMFGVAGTYSTTDSVVGGVFLRSYWDADSKRLIAGVGGGRIYNDYEDFLGTSAEAETTDEMKAAFVRYIQEFSADWFIGGQATYANYTTYGDSFNAQQILDTAGLTGIKSGAVGMVLEYDTRDTQNTPTSGTHLNVNNLAYREALGGDHDFDTLNAEFAHYLPHGDGNVFAWRVFGRATHDAPPSGYSSVELRGYTRGQYLSPNSVSFEAEERWHLHGRFGINAFAGVTCLFGDGDRCDRSDNLYPAAGVGAQYTIKPEEHMVISTDYAVGKDGNNGFYVRLGQAF
ncbi:BamA/TamA family outer membrane protein [Halomonas huangheensis]|uniref:Uncharacterized protein n=1 Tax=Halomonas huangheensis TaxID=1178482 RepID=W1NCS0_9GAMM|nr:BamA/TamA family outer membrane protein [Halomonas huangheensis]ALM52806.1 hypothetical protein AR456_11335 [Halomonas huangheensis]ERL53283.1 hypothetical protein BJB45_18600 [Halomonas huangheensis]